MAGEERRCWKPPGNFVFRRLAVESWAALNAAVH